MMEVHTSRNAQYKAKPSTGKQWKVNNTLAFFEDNCYLKVHNAHLKLSLSTG